jgi:NAD(P) transhydrogenase subunit alpha
MPQLIGVPREVAAGEKRVATVPEVVEKLIKLGFRVAVEPGAGDAANFADDTYRAAGAEIIADVWGSADIVFKVRAPSTAEVARMREGQTLVSFLWPAQNPELMQALSAKKVTVPAMDAAHLAQQKPDALSLDGHILPATARVVEAAHHFGRFFTGQITPAGKVPPAKVFTHRRGRGGARRDRRGGLARSCAPTTRAPSRRPDQVARRRVSCPSTTSRKARAPAATLR